MKSEFFPSSLAAQSAGYRHSSVRPTDRPTAVRRQVVAVSSRGRPFGRSRYLRRAVRPPVSLLLFFLSALSRPETGFLTTGCVAAAAAAWQRSRASQPALPPPPPARPRSLARRGHYNRPTYKVLLAGRAVGTPEKRRRIYACRGRRRRTYVGFTRGQPPIGRTGRRKSGWRGRCNMTSRSDLNSSLSLARSLPPSEQRPSSIRTYSNVYRQFERSSFTFCT